MEDVLGKPSCELLRIMRQNGEKVEDLLPLVMLEATSIACPTVYDWRAPKAGATLLKEASRRAGEMAVWMAWWSPSKM